MVEPLNCPTCGHQTLAGRRQRAEHHRAHPIYGMDLSRPLSVVIEEIRSKITAIRGSLNDVRYAFPGWGERVEAVEGLLTCGIVTLYSVMKEMADVEARQATEPPHAPK